MNPKQFILLISIVIFALSVQNCRKDKSVDAPAIPPSNSLEMDFLSFLNLDNQVSQQLSSSNYLSAYNLVNFWYTEATTFMSLPAQAFNAVISNKNPNYTSDVNQWTWNAQFTSATQESYVVELTGSSTGDSTYWEMYITQVGVGVKFLWLNGESYTTQGWWKIYSPLQGPALLINWDHVNNQSGTLQYTDIISGDVNNGAYITIGNTSTNEKYYNINILNDVNDPQYNNVPYLIDWNPSNNVGDIQWNGGKLCWGSNLLNNTCN